MKRASFIIALLLVVAVSAFALDATVTWSWSLNDPDVKYFRYQLDGEETENWTVVDVNVLSASFDLDVSVDHTLYLQQSYDGSYWSPSSYTVAAAVVTEPAIEEVSEVAEVAPVAEAPAEAVVTTEVAAVEVLEEEVAPVEETVEPKEPVEEPVEVVKIAEDVETEESTEPAMPIEEPVAPAEPALPAEEVVAKVDTKKAARSIINLGVVYGNNIPFNRDTHLLGASIGYTYLFGTKSAFSFGVKAQVAVYNTLDMIKASNYAVENLNGTANVLFVGDYSASWGDVYLGIGGGVFAPLKFNSYLIGASAQLGTRLNVFKAFGVGFEVDGCYYLYPTTTDRKIDINGRVYLSLAF